MTKVCKDCKTEKPLDEYFNDKGFKSGKMAICKACKQAKTLAWRKDNKPKYNALAVRWRDKNPEKQHATDIKRIYGLSIERYNEMLTEQACKCKICGKQHDPSIKRGRLYVDHDHQTGEVRGLLCGACNSAIGYFQDKTEVLYKAIDYLKKAK